MRKPLIIIGILLLLAVVPTAVIAASGVLSSAVDRQTARWTTSSVATSSTTWRNVPGFRVTADTIGEVSASLSVTLEGAPALFRVVVDTSEAPMKPGPARFVPSGRESFAFTFVANTIPFEGDDTHTFTVQWRSPSGQQVTLQRGTLNLVYQLGTNGEQ